MAFEHSGTSPPVFQAFSFWGESIEYQTSEKVTFFFKKKHLFLCDWTVYQKWYLKKIVSTNNKACVICVLYQEMKSGVTRKHALSQPCLIRDIAEA